MIDMVNVVGSGSFCCEFDLSVLATELGTLAEFDPEKYPGMYVRFDEDSVLVTVYRTGKFIITGAESIRDLDCMKSDLLELFKRRGIVDGGDLEWFQVQNLVCTTVLADKLDLNRLSIGLGLEKTEYEPEQFPGLIYRNPEFECVALVFSTGKAVLTGSSDLDNIETFADHLIHKLSSFQLN